MSLQVWLPLNGNLKNKGVDDITVTNNGATVNDSGKIGKCYVSAAKDDLVISGYQTTLKTFTKYSMCAWIYMTSTPSSHSTTILGSGNWNTVNGSCVFALYDYNNGYSKLLVPNKTKWNNYITLTNKLVLNTWYHIAITYDGTSTKGYVNGEYVGTLAAGGICENSNSNDVNIGSATYSASFTLQGKINDVRIYDNCISPAEIKEISRALMLHYKFNDWEVVTSRCSSVTWNQMISNGDFSNGTTGWSNVANSTLSVSNGEFTISKYQKGSAGGICKLTTVSGFDNTHLYYIKAVAKTNCDYAIFVGFSAGTSVGGNTQLSTTSQTYETISAIVSPVNNSDIFVIRMGTSASPEGSSGCCKSVMCIDLTTMFGAGNEPTKGEFEKLFPKDYYSYDAGTSLSMTMDIPDSSGYGNLGEIVGTASLNTNTPRYDACTYMNNRSTTNHIETNAIANTNTFSVSFWLNADKDVSQVFVADPSMTIGFLSGGISVNPVSAKIFGCGNFTSNEWNHIVAIKNGTEYSIYINGVQRSQLSTSTYYVHNANKLWILNRSYNSSYAANAYISDFRIYATVLSEADILQLYNVGGKIDNLGNVHSYMIDETSVNTKELFVENIQTNNGVSYMTNHHDGIYLNSYVRYLTNYLPILPESKKYIYDATVSVAAGNQFYIGIERYDADKTSRSNNACVYIVSTKPSSDVTYKRYTGTVNLATDSVNPCRFIRLRILNAWTNTDSESTKIAIIHKLSLREMPSDTTDKTKLLNTGVFKTDLLLEGNTKAEIEKNIDMNINEFIEM